MFAPRQIRVALGGLVSSMVIGAVLSAAAEPQSTKPASPRANAGKPAYFVEWPASGAPPGMTERPSPGKNPAPVFPAESARRRESGRTILSVCVTTEGRLVDVRITQSSGFTRLDEATLAWTRSAKFNPGRINGDPVNICGYPLEYEWRLGN